jgi:3-phenylpropionate/trans-cinnamate dioxygenase ferredoxin component
MDRVMRDQDYVAVARVGEIAPDSARLIDRDGTAILLCNSEDRIFAIASQCSHAQEELTCGRIKWGWIACPAHGTRFDLESGEPMNPPATEAIRTFPVRIVGENIEVAL